MRDTVSPGGTALKYNARRDKVVCELLCHYRNGRWGPGKQVRRSGVDLDGLTLLGLDLSGLDLSVMDSDGLDLSELDLSGLDLHAFSQDGLDLLGLDPSCPTKRYVRFP